MDFGNPKKLRFVTMQFLCILFRVLKRLDLHPISGSEAFGGGRGGGGVANRYRLCDTPNEA